MIYVLYNSVANNKNKNEKLENYQKEGMILKDVLDLDYRDFFQNLLENDVIYLFGGDGTINYLENEISIDELENDIYLIPSGTGNDFYHDVIKGEEEKILLNPYLKNLPTVEVNGIKRKFINGIGFGIDGYCCEVGDELRAKSDKPVNYTSIAIKGLLFHFKPRNAKISVDGKEYEFQHVWLAPSMKGRFYGGGMMVAPNQNRNEKGVVTVVVYKTRSKLKALMTFPSIFKGEHIKKEKMVKIFKGKEIVVTFDRPTPLQIDGDTVRNVITYKVHA